MAYPLGVKQQYPAVKSEADYSKRKQAEALVKPQAPKRARAAGANENAAQDQRTTALLEELLERDTRQCTAAAPAGAFGQAGPTDFSGLFPRAQPGPAAAAAAAQGQQQQQRTARTFDDLAGQRGQGQRQVLGDLLPGNDWLPPALPALAAGEASNLTAVVAAVGSDRQLAPAPSAPVDWSLKTTVRFVSPNAFAVAHDAAVLSAGELLAAQRAFTCCDVGTHRLSMQQQYLAALHSWQYPQDPWRQPVPVAPKQRNLPPETVQRRADWQTAFASLYDALRGGACDAFYCLSPAGSKKEYAVLFGATGIGGRQRIHALLTRSTAGLRALLRGGVHLGFATPLLPSDADRRVELDQSAVSLDNGSQSLLVFEGAQRVHGLFDFLLNESFRTHGDECDVPTLLAPVQFAHASITAFQPRVLGEADARDAKRSQHRLELRATALPPWVLDRLAAVLAVTQDGCFSMACDTHPLTLALNWCGGSAAAAAAEQAAGYSRAAALTDHGSRQRGCWDAEEAARWRAAVPGLSCNVVRELGCQGGTFTAKLSAKSAERADFHR